MVGWLVSCRCWMLNVRYYLGEEKRIEEILIHEKGLCLPLHCTHCSLPLPLPHLYKVKDLPYLPIRIPIPYLR